jgi:hypothetical protein
MRIQMPKNDAKYYWTSHVGNKMMYYGLSADRVKRVIRSPYRCEKGIAPDTIAVMQPGKMALHQAPGKPSGWKEEIWVMYATKTNNSKLKTNNKNQKSSVVGYQSFVGPKKIIITAWRYPGKSPIREAIPIPNDILEELKHIKY